MSNNRKSINRNLFRRLEKLLPSDSSVANELKKGDTSVRYIHTESGSIAQELLTNAKIVNSIKTYNNLMLFGVSFQSKIYLVITENQQLSGPFINGVTSVLDPDNSEQNIEKNPGLITFLFSQIEFPFVQSIGIGYDLMEKIFGREGFVDGKFSASEIMPFFSEFSVWELDEKYLPLNDNVLLALSSAYLISTSEKMNLIFEEETIQKFKLLTEDLPIRLIGGNIYRAVVAMEWKHTFLELYQCIEFLFTIPYIIKLTSNLGDESHFKVLFQNIEDDLEWRPKENKALELLFREINENASVQELYDSCKKIFHISVANENEKKVELIAKYVYRTRNSIAHFRSNSDIVVSQESEWDELVSKLSMTVYDLYKKYSSQISLIS